MADIEKTMLEIMKNGELPEFVAIDEDVLSASEREEIICETVVEGSLPSVPVKVDLVKMAFYYIQGYTGKDIARLFGTDEGYISRIKSSPKFKSIITALNAEIISTARVFMAASGMKAVTTLVKCMDSRDDRTKLKAATEVLDRIGIKTPEQFEIIQKGDKISAMDEEQLLSLVKLGMKEILPQNREGTYGEQETKGVSES